MFWQIFSFPIFISPTLFPLSLFTCFSLCLTPLLPRFPPESPFLSVFWDDVWGIDRYAARSTETPSKCRQSRSCPARGALRFPSCWNKVQTQKGNLNKRTQEIQARANGQSVGTWSRLTGGKERAHTATTPFPKSGIKNTTVPQGPIQTKKRVQPVVHVPRRYIQASRRSNYWWNLPQSPQVSNGRLWWAESRLAGSVRDSRAIFSDCVMI